MPRGTLCPVPHLSGDIRLQNQWLAESVLCALLPHLKCHVSKTELGIFDLLPATCCGFSILSQWTAPPSAQGQLQKSQGHSRLLPICTSELSPSPTETNSQSPAPSPALPVCLPLPRFWPRQSPGNHGGVFLWCVGSTMDPERFFFLKCKADWVTS